MYSNIPVTTELSDAEPMDNTAVTLPAITPRWWTGKAVDEVAYAEDFLEKHPMKCLNDELFDYDGKVTNLNVLKSLILEQIKPYVRMNIMFRVNKLVDTIKGICNVETLEEDCLAINLANGTYNCAKSEEERFSPEKQICRYRLPIEYQPNPKPPVLFTKFLCDLFYEEDIPTIQEYVGYCLIPLTDAQKMLLIIGRGGEGKSTFGNLLLGMFGSAALNGSLHSLEATRFNTAELEHKLLMIDDDMKLDALPSTNKIKTIVTAQEKIMVEKKGIQPYPATVYSRLIGLGNYALESFNDSSAGFFRRQIIIRTKDAVKGRATDPFMLSHLRSELPAIFLWAVDGLMRLLANNFQFSLSERAKNNLAEVMLEANNIPDFIHDPILELGSYNQVSSTELYQTYRNWCENNGEESQSRRRFTKFLKESGGRYGIQYSRSVNSGNAYVRGFIGVKVKA